MTFREWGMPIPVASLSPAHPVTNTEIRSERPRVCVCVCVSVCVCLGNGVDIPQPRLPHPQYKHSAWT